MISTSIDSSSKTLEAFIVPIQSGLMLLLGEYPSYIFFIYEDSYRTATAAGAKLQASDLCTI